MRSQSKFDACSDAVKRRIPSERYAFAVSDLGEKSALLVPIPEVGSLVAQWRDELDPAATRGIPAHVTVLFPFAAPSSINESMIEVLTAVLESSERFAVVFNETKWFDDRVLYLAPDPDSGFRRLSQALQTAFPEFPPYGAVYDDPIPHLTIGDGAPIEKLRAAATAVTSLLPVSVTISEVWLMAGSMEPHSWSRRERFTLKG
jgi:2'-5' RNA ligase